MVKLVNPLQPAKAFQPIEVTLEGMVKLVNPLQPEKAPPPIEVTLEGMVKQSTATIKSTPVYRSNTGRDGQACQSTAT